VATWGLVPGALLAEGSCSSAASRLLNAVAPLLPYASRRYVLPVRGFVVPIREPPGGGSRLAWAPALDLGLGLALPLAAATAAGAAALASDSLAPEPLVDGSTRRTIRHGLQTLRTGALP
jgi:hypothetical protein